MTTLKFVNKVSKDFVLFKVFVVVVVKTMRTKKLPGYEELSDPATNREGVIFTESVLCSILLPSDVNQTRIFKTEHWPFSLCSDF